MGRRVHPLGGSPWPAQDRQTRPYLTEEVIGSMIVWQFGDASPAEIYTKRPLRGNHTEKLRIMQLHGTPPYDRTPRGTRGRNSVQSLLARNWFWRVSHEHHNTILQIPR